MKLQTSLTILVIKTLHLVYILFYKIDITTIKQRRYESGKILKLIGYVRPKATRYFHYLRNNLCSSLLSLFKAKPYEQILTQSDASSHREHQILTGVNRLRLTTFLIMDLTCETWTRFVSPRSSWRIIGKRHDS